MGLNTEDNSWVNTVRPPVGHALIHGSQIMHSGAHLESGERHVVVRSHSHSLGCSLVCSFRPTLPPSKDLLILQATVYGSTVGTFAAHLLRTLTGLEECGEIGV
jgi:hypothetical protein